MADEGKRAKRTASRRLGTEEVAESTKAAKPERIINPDAHLPAVIDPEIVGDVTLHDGDQLHPWLDIPEGLAFEEWAARAPEVKSAADRLSTGVALLTKVSDCLLMRIGDYLNYGEDNYTAEQMAQFMDGERYGYSIESVKHAMWVCREIPKDERMEGVTYTHYSRTARLDKKDRKHWLKRAVAEGLSAADMQREMRGEPAKKGKRQGAKHAPPPPVVHPMQFTAAEFGRTSDIAYKFYEVLFEHHEAKSKDKDAEVDIEKIHDAATAVGHVLRSLLLALNQAEEDEAAA